MPDKKIISEEKEPEPQGVSNGEPLEILHTEPEITEPAKP